MAYKRDFDPRKVRLAPPKEDELARRDLRDGSVYVCDPDTRRAVRVAMATGRPLLLGGLPGSGKSSLAAFIARDMGWHYFEMVVTSNTRAQDLKWNVDEVRRLRDARTDKLEDDLRVYIDPGVLWWAFDPESARERGINGSLPERFVEAPPPGKLQNGEAPSVALIDEIDKADPDVPNDCLVALGSQLIRVHGTDAVIEPRRSVPPPLVLITTNNERALPPAFIRRCVVHRLDSPKATRLVEIAEAHFPKEAKEHESTFQKIADRIEVEQEAAGEESVDCPSTAEYLDAVRACIELDVKPESASDLWKTIESAVLQKRKRLL